MSKDKIKSVYSIEQYFILKYHFEKNRLKFVCKTEFVPIKDSFKP